MYGIVVDEFGVPRVVRYRVEAGSGAELLSGVIAEDPEDAEVVEGG